MEIFLRPYHIYIVDRHIEGISVVIIASLQKQALLSELSQASLELFMSMVTFSP